MCKKNQSSGFANNKGAYQSAHPRSLISAFVMPLLESISRIAAMEISNSGKKTNRGPVAQCPYFLGWAPKTKCSGAQLAPEKRVVCKGMKSCPI